MTRQRILPPLPDIGHPEGYYARKVHDADRQGDMHAREAYKVGQYITLAKNPNLGWEDKLRYFCHALRRHCVPPPLPDEEIWLFYQELANLVRAHCGLEALRLASHEDDLYAARLSMGQPKEKIEDEAELFFKKLIHANECPVWFNAEDWEQLKLIRDHWI